MIDVAPRPAQDPVYLGDGLYAVFDGYQIELYASNGIQKTNRVYLDPSVCDSFLSFVEAIRSSR